MPPGEVMLDPSGSYLTTPETTRNSGGRKHLGRIGNINGSNNLRGNNLQAGRLTLPVKKSDIQQFTSWLGKCSYKARLKRLGIERLAEIARENGKKGGRPKGYSKKQKQS